MPINEDFQRVERILEKAKPTYNIGDKVFYFDLPAVVFGVQSNTRYSSRNKYKYKIYFMRSNGSWSDAIVGVRDIQRRVVKPFALKYV